MQDEHQSNDSGPHDANASPETHKKPHPQETTHNTAMVHPENKSTQPNSAQAHANNAHAKPPKPAVEQPSMLVQSLPSNNQQKQPAYTSAQASQPVLKHQATIVESKESMPVVKVWSIRGVEYAMMTWMLWAAAIATNWVLVAFVFGTTGFIELAPPLALLIVSLPVFGFFFMRLKKAELMDPSLRTESTKRRFSQRTQVIAFIVVFIAFITIVASLLSAAGGESDGIGKTITAAFMFVLVWGSLLFYYWNDEHRNLR